jgi:hypothetical protein
VERLEARELLSGAPNDLHDPWLAPIAQAEYLQDNHHLSRDDVIHLLKVVDGAEQPIWLYGQLFGFAKTPLIPTNTILASQVADLQTLARDAAAWGLSPDVANLTSKLVNFNPANTTWRGNPLLPNGRLAGGQTDRQLEELINKWFYGTDLPVLAAAVQNNMPKGMQVDYEKAAGTLFGPNGPSPDDIAQGYVGDCYFLASLGEVAEQSPQTIKNMFIDNHDGTYAVRFWEYDPNRSGWVADYVTVDLQLPTVHGSKLFAFAGWYQGGQAVQYTDPNAVLWPALLEKAYAQLASEGWSRSIDNAPIGSGIDQTPADWNQSSYDALAMGNGVALEQILGSDNTTDIAMLKFSPRDPVQVTLLKQKLSAANEAEVVQDFAAGKFGILGSLASEPNGSPIDSGHVYYLTGADSVHDRFTVFNPYDDYSIAAGDGPRVVTLAWHDLEKYFADCFFVTAPMPTVVKSPVSLGAINYALLFSMSGVNPGDAVQGTPAALAASRPTAATGVALSNPAVDFNFAKVASLLPASAEGLQLDFLVDFNLAGSGWAVVGAAGAGLTKATTPIRFNAPAR